MRKTALALAVGLMVAFSWLPSQALDKVRWGAAVKGSAFYYLPNLAAQEKGFWKENGLEAELIEFRGGPALSAAMAGGHVDLGGSMAASVFQAMAAGLSATMVSDLYPKNRWYFWVRADSPLKGGTDLKGKKLGVHAFYTGSHALARLVAKALGIEKDLKMVSTGGIMETVAALKAGVVDGVGAYSVFLFAKLEARGEARPLIAVDEFLPGEWSEHLVYARNDFMANQPETVRRAVRAIVQASNFIRDNLPWAAEAMKKVEGLADTEVKLIIEREGLKFTRDGKLSRKALENVRTFLIDYGIVAGEKAPPIDKIFTDRFVR